MTSAKILLIEDNPDDAFLTLHALSKAGIRDVAVVHEAHGALDYLCFDGNCRNRIGKELPRLILLDLNLPAMNGFEFIETIRCNEATYGIPVMVLTSSNDARDIASCEKLKVAAYFTKPLDVDRFKMEAEKLLLF